MKRSEPDEAKAKSPLAGMKQPIRLLLHTVDGVIPYMTPLLLKAYFPPEKTADCLVLGIAVRDTCVSPLYPHPNEDESQNKKSSKTRKLDPTKPCGYTFKSTTIDNFLSQYSTVIAPSFDLHLDASGEGSSNVAATNKGVMMWTPHGRQRLDPDTHYDAAYGLESSSQCIGTVPLFDLVLDEATSKRRRTASQRTLTWLEQHLQRHDKDGIRRSNSWVPFQLHINQDSQTIDRYRDIKERVKQLNETMKSYSTVSGVAIVGWTQYGGDRSLLRGGVEAMRETFSQLHNFANVSVLSTRTMSEVLDAIRCGANVIGSNLPTHLAKSKMAFLWSELEGWAQPEKKLKVQENEVEPVQLDENGAADMHHETLARDERPLILGCGCLACKHSKHSRAYIHHLVQAKELLAEILLFGHNLFQLLLLCREATKATDQNMLDEFCDYVEAQMLG